VKALLDLVRGKSVAVVGNAMSLLDSSVDLGGEIDSHDIVLRMNAGLPNTPVPVRGMAGIYAKKVGYRTDIWATAKWFGIEPKDAKLGIFMKLTALGDRHWQKFQETQDQRSFPMERWPMPMERQVRDFVGADPGTGIRMVYALKRWATPASVRLFGMDCWDTVSTWSGKPNTPNHVPNLEKEALRLLMSE